MNELILYLVIIVLLGIIFFIFKFAIKKNNELKDLKLKMETEENEKQKREELKNEIYYGDNGNTFDNIADILRQHQDRTEKN